MRKIFLGLMGLMGLMGCRSTRYVPVETVRTEMVHQTDTVKETNTINNEKETVIREARPEDSVMLAKLGIKLQNNERLLILLQKELSDTKKELEEKHNSDSVRVEYKDKPYPVEKQLTKWQSFCIDYGKIMVGVTVSALAVIVLLIILRIKKK